MLFRRALLTDISLLCAEYSRAACEWGFGPIPDMDAVITASVADRALVLPYDVVFGVDNARFKIDVVVGETLRGEFAGFYVRKALVLDSGIESAAPFGIATELWYVAVNLGFRRLGIGARLVRDAVTVTYSETQGMDGLLARVTGPNDAMTQILQSQGFFDVGTECCVSRVWMHPKSDKHDQFADFVYRR